MLPSPAEDRDVEGAPLPPPLSLLLLLLRSDFSGAEAAALKPAAAAAAAILCCAAHLLAPLRELLSRARGIASSEVGSVAAATDMVPFVQGATWATMGAAPGEIVGRVTV